MDDKTIERINELARKSRETELTAEEKEEQQRLRQEYVAAVRKNLRAQLDNTYIVRPNGNKEAVKNKRKVQ